MGRLDADDRGTASPSAAAVEGRARPAVDGGGVACDAQGDPPLLRDERYGKIRRGGLLDAQGDPPLLGQPSSAGLVGAPPVSLAQPASSSQSGSRARARARARLHQRAQGRRGGCPGVLSHAILRSLRLIASHCVSLRFTQSRAGTARWAPSSSTSSRRATSYCVLLRLRRHLIASYCV